VSYSCFPFLEDLADILSLEHDVELLRVEHLLETLLNKDNKLLDVLALGHLPLEFAYVGDSLIQAVMVLKELLCLARKGGIVSRYRCSACRLMLVRGCCQRD
jgi:hypothetical protein